MTSVRRITSRSWQQRLTRNDKGNIRSTLANATLVLTHDSPWTGVLGYDERAEQAMLLRTPPFSDAPPSTYPRQLRDGDDVRTAQWLEEAHGITVNLPNVHAALNAVAEMQPFDSVRAYLEAVEWDGTERLSAWPIRYLGVPPSPYASAVGRAWMISAVARTFRPGAKVDHVLVLEGPQGLGKSTALKALAGDEYFGDDVPAIGSKDCQQYLGGLWIIELAEMDAAIKAESATLKRFLTTCQDRYRPPYGRRMVMHDRRCVFAGTVNLDEYLRDSTGGRRFWPLRCGKVDLEGLQRDRDQLWAEAVAAYRAGEPWHLTNEVDIEAAAEQQSQRQERDPWHETIDSYLSGAPEFVTTNRILTSALQMDIERATRRETLRVGQIMRHLGWEYATDCRPDGTRTRGWRRKGAAHA